MFVQINFKSGLPVYLQIVEQVKVAAAAGALRAGESLPSIRPLAEQLRVNRNTVAKAYTELEQQGIVESIPGKGCFLKANNTPYRREVRQQMLAEVIDAALVQAHHLQIDQEDFISLMKQRMKVFEQKPSSVKE